MSYKELLDKISAQDWATSKFMNLNSEIHKVQKEMGSHMFEIIEKHANEPDFEKRFTHAMKDYIGSIEAVLKSVQL